MSLPAVRIERVRARRRTAMRVGFLMILAASATACIFDQSDYKGGGRLDKGATAKPPPLDAEAPIFKPPGTIPEADAASE